MPAETGTGSDSKHLCGECPSPQDPQPPASMFGRGTAAPKARAPSVTQPFSPQPVSLGMCAGSLEGCYWRIPAPRSSKRCSRSTIDVGPSLCKPGLAFSRNNRVCLLSLSCTTLTWLPSYNPASSIITSSNKSPCETQPSGNPLTTEIRLQSRAWF